MDSLDLIKLQISLEYRINSDGRLVAFNGSSEQAYYLIYHYSEGYMPLFNHLLPSELRQQLLTLGSAEAFEHPGKVIKLISESYQPCMGGDEVFWSGYFFDPPEPIVFPEAIQEGKDWVVMLMGQVVSRATSVRQNECCSEVYVETTPAYRRRGFGQQAVAAWAHDILKSRRIPFYSYHLTNNASAALADRLGVEWYADVVAYEPA